MASPRLNILHVIPSVSLSQGGPSRAIAEMERVLSARGIAVTTVTTNDDGKSRKLLVPCGKPIAGTDGTRWYFRRTTVFYKFSLGLALWLKRNIGAYDVVHVHGLFSFAPVIAAMLARRAGVPYVIRPYGVLANYGMTKRRPVLKKLSLRFIERRLLRSANAVQFTSEGEQREAEAFRLQFDGVVIPLGIDIAPSGKATAERAPKSRTELLFLSRIDRKKNLEGLLQALSLLVARRKDVTLRIAGSGDRFYVERLKLLAGSLGLAGHVEWCGFIDGVEKMAALTNADAFILPSFSENFGIAVVEALAAGLPCIVSKEVAVQGDIAKAGAGIIVGVDAHSIAEGIERFLNEGSSHLRMSLAARKLAAESFSAEKMGERLETLYRDCLQSKALAA